MRNRSSHLGTAAILLGCLLFRATLMLCTAQDERDEKLGPPDDSAKLVQVRIGRIGGLYGDPGYCTTLKPFIIMSESNCAGNKHKFPDRKVRSAITNREWESLQRSIDRKEIEALHQSSECQLCIDLPESWVELAYRDGSRTTASYDPTNPPAPAAVLRQISFIRQRHDIAGTPSEPPTHSLPPSATITVPLLQASPQESSAARSPIPDAAGAKKRAENVLASKKWFFPPLKAELKDGVWTVMGTEYCQEALPSPKVTCYGGAGVRLRKSDGEFLEIFPPRNN